jgi:type IV secretory pathway TraG/TraD family ATPase VirD4
MFQSWPSVVNTLGQSGAEELEACSTMQYFAINDQATAERISRRLGHFTAKERQGLFGPKQASIREVKTPAEVLRELSINSTLSYVMGGGMPPMRLERLAYKALVTREGTRFRGLPLEGQYDEGLSQYTYGDEPM